MNPELNPTHLVPKSVDEPSARAVSPSTPSGYPAANALPSPDFPDGDGDDAAIARAQTLMIDLSTAEENVAEPDTPGELVRYVQGVAQGQRAYIITNLLGRSELLIQPQMVWTIGRNREAAIPLKDRAMSRRHAVLLYVAGVGFQMIDLNSMNGSFINGERIRQRQLLKDGDRVRLGGINFTFFVSCQTRSLDATHPEVLTRFNESGSYAADFIDYAALEDPDILIKSRD
jgi:pSer/pThr/pTyr-binding forkhead associated (FHA) protein